MKLLAALAVPVCFVVAQTDRTPPLTVNMVRHWSVSDVTRVAIEVSGDFQYHSDRLHDPERVYYDIVNSRPRLGPDKKISFAETVDDRLLKRVRVAETTPGTTRVVLDLGPSVQLTTSQLPNPNRLIVELRSMGGAPSVPTQPPDAASLSAPAKPLPPPPVIAPPVSAPKAPAAIKSDPSEQQVNAEPAKSELGNAAETPSLPAPTLPVVPAPAPKPATPPAGPFEQGRAARPTTTGDTSLVRALGLKVNRIVIDAGHGGHDEGTHGAHGLIEKELVLDVALRLGKLVEDRLGAEVVYTRRDDTFIPLDGRTALANERKADLFLSIHANSSSARSITGVETFYLNFPSSRDAADVAARENAESDKTVFDLRDLVDKIALHEKSEESKEFAARVQAALFAFSSRNFPAEPNRGVKKAPFVVLIGANMPSILAEIGFLTNSREEALLKRADYRQRVAEALFSGLSKYADSLSHFRIATAGAAPQ